jgi:general secretion pathway protein N
LLAAFAGWAVLAWILALAGMGGRVAPLPEDASLQQSLPQVRPSPDERLGPLSRYDAIAARPVFSEDRRPHPFSLRQEGEGEEDKDFDYVLTSVIIAPTLKMAVLQPAEDDGGEPIQVKLGEASERAAAWRLVTLEPRRAVFEGPEGQRSLDLRAYDGSGGQPATPRSRPPDNPVVVGRSEPVAPVEVDDTAQAVRAAANDATEAAKPPSPPAAAIVPPGQPGTEPTITTPEAQIEAIRQRIQARREQLRREAQQSQSENNP